jgi:hypothetical protein
MKLIEFPVSELEGWLPNIWPMLKEACERSSGKYEPMDIVRQIAAKRMQLWNAMDDNKIHAIGITEIIQYPHTKVCRVLAATGEDLKILKEMMPKLEEWAKEIGCAWIEPVCRPGYEKALKTQGFKKQHIILEKKL